MNNVKNNPFDEIELSPQDTIDIYKNKSGENPFDELDFDESFWSSAFRTLSQVPQGLASTTTPGLLAGLWEMMAVGEVMNPEDIEHLKMISEREGIPFDEDAYMQAAEKALSGIPTVSNIAKGVEEKTGLPLEPKTRLQKGLRFATEATRLAPEGGGIRGTNVKLPKPVLGAAVEGTKEGLIELGVPEQAAEIASFGILHHPPEGSPSLSFKKTKPSGMSELGFEKLNKPTQISEGKVSQINQKIESEFRNIASDIIEKSPIEETLSNLKNDKTFKKVSGEAFQKVEELAHAIPGEISTDKIQKNLISQLSQKKEIGYAPSEYETYYNKFIKDEINKIGDKNITQVDLVKQYRKNNLAFAELKEPGQSSAYNRAKKDAILDHNKAIAATIEQAHPDTEYSNLFKSSNEQWAKIMDAEAIDTFLGDLFEGKIQYGKGAKLLEKQGMQQPFKRALGKEGYKNFEQLLQDLMSTQDAHKMMKVAESKGNKYATDLAMKYVIHPDIAHLKVAKDIGKFSYKKIWEYALDKPQFTLKWDQGVKDFKKGKFNEANKIFKELDSEITQKP